MAGRRVSYPVEALRAQVTALEAAIARVLARPKKDAVHELRKSTRKIEAQLAVIAELAQQEPGFKAITQPAKRVAKLLGKLRKAAGRVRDLDVQRKLAKEEIERGTTKKIRKEAKELRRELKAERAVGAEALIEALKAHALKLEPELERLVEELEPVAKVGLSAVELEVLTRGWYQKRRGKAEREDRPAEQMHGVRKAAKLARYMVEDGGVAARVVKEFEALQEAGGRWHDSLTLRELARARLGKQSGLAELLEQRENATRSEFREMLAVS